LELTQSTQPAYQNPA
jgi:hypothetical protein